MRRLKNDGEKVVSEDGPRELVRLKKDGEKLVSEDGLRELMMRRSSWQTIAYND